MNILVISTFPTHPTDGGTENFIRKYCELMKDMGHDVFFLYVVKKAIKQLDNKKNKDAVGYCREAWGEKHFFYYQAGWLPKFREVLRRYLCNTFVKCDTAYPYGLTRYVRGLDEKIHFDACIVNCYFLTKLLPKIKIERKACVTHDCFTYRVYRTGFFTSCSLTPNEEAKAMQRVPYIFAMQNEEASFFKHVSPKSKVLVNYSFNEYISQPVAGNHNILFLSGKNNFNREGLEWFILNIFPKILEEYPDARLKIAGGICSYICQYERLKNIDILGYVESQKDFYLLGDVSINPVKSGTGLKIKTFEALAYDKVTLVHPHSTQGIFRKESAPLLVCEEPQEWVDALKYVWNSLDNIKQIKQSNKQYIEAMNIYVKSQFRDFLEGELVRL